MRPEAAEEERPALSKYDHVDLAEVGIELKPGEPWFLIRGQDICAPSAILAYATELSDHLDPDKWEPVGELQAFAKRVSDWQDANPDFVKVPD